MMHKMAGVRVLHDWEEIAADLQKVIHLDAKRSMIGVLGEALAGRLQFWRMASPSEGYVATQVTKDRQKRTFWIIYAGGKGRGITQLRQSMAEIAWQARKERCQEIRFQGRDWRRVFPEFAASFSDGIWHYRKAL